MAHHIPKIEYGGFIPTVIQFDYPPEVDDGEEFDAKERATPSLSGLRQVSVDFIEATRKLKFKFLSEAKLEALRTFFLSHAALGNTFKYFTDSTSMEFDAYELKNFTFAPKRIASRTQNQYWYELALQFRRVVNEDFKDCMEAIIANGQAVAADITGLLLDSSSYKSAKVFFELRRKTDSEERVQNGALTFLYRESTAAWELAGEFGDGDLSGVTFSITTAGQVQYTSDTVAGANYTGKIEFRNFTIC